jgi:hypothetical protein
MIAGQNVWWDFVFLQNKCLKYGIGEEFENTFGHRVFDLSALAQIKYREKNGKFNIKEGKNAMNLSAALEFCGFEDNRRKMIDGKITEGEPHNALEDVKLAEKCFRSLLK